jgi:uncharacterized protein YecT (DUF1311 family)
MRSLLLLSFVSAAMLAQQPQKGSEQPAKNEEDSCCCTTYDTNMCLSKVEEKVDKELNTVYERALKRWHDDPENAELRDAERTWIAYRDATCKAESGLYRGGTIMPSVGSRCILRVTRQRIADLKDAYLFNR